MRQNQRAERDPFIEMTNNEFVKMFRFSKQICTRHISEIEPHLKSIVKCDAITNNAKFLCAIWFFTTGKFYNNAFSLFSFTLLTSLNLRL